MLKQTNPVIRSVSGSFTHTHTRIHEGQVAGLVQITGSTHHGLVHEPLDRPRSSTLKPQHKSSEGWPTYFTPLPSLRTQHTVHLLQFTALVQRALHCGACAQLRARTPRSRCLSEVRCNSTARCNLQSCCQPAPTRWGPSPVTRMASFTCICKPGAALPLIYTTPSPSQHSHASQGYKKTSVQLIFP